VRATEAAGRRRSRTRRAEPEAATSGRDRQRPPKRARPAPVTRPNVRNARPGQHAPHRFRCSPQRPRTRPARVNRGSLTTTPTAQRAPANAQAHSTADAVARPSSRSLRASVPPPVRSVAGLPGPERPQSPCATDAQRDRVASLRDLGRGRSRLIRQTVSSASRRLHSRTSRPSGRAPAADCSPVPLPRSPAPNRFQQAETARALARPTRPGDGVAAGAAGRILAAGSPQPPRR
jgi:hypothetical protein